MHFKCQPTCSGSTEWINIRNYSIIPTSDPEPEEQIPFLSVMEAPHSPLPNSLFPKIQAIACASLPLCCTGFETTISLTKLRPFQLINFPICISFSSRGRAFQLGIQYAIALYVVSADECKQAIKTQTTFFLFGAIRNPRLVFFKPIANQYVSAN